MRPRRLSTALALALALGLSALARPGGGQPEPPNAPEAPKSATPPAPPAASAGEPAPSPPATRKTINPAGVIEAVQKLSADVQRWGGSAGVLVIDVPTGAVLAALNEHTAFNPASNAKLVTAVAALRTLGPQHRFLTGLYGKQTGDAVGELVLRGQGDPSLRMGDLAEMARELASAGVRRVRSIGVDQSYFDDRYAPPAFEQQPHEWAAFRAPVAAVSLNSNTVLFTVRPSEQGKSALLSVEPPGLIDLAGAVRTSAKGDPEKITLTLEPRGDRLAATFGGTVPEKSRPVRIARRVEDPRLLAGYALRAALKDAGIEVTGDVHTANSREKKLLAAHRSEPLGELLTALGKESDNFYAEMIFKALGASKKGDPATSEAGAEAAALGGAMALGEPGEPVTPLGATPPVPGAPGFWPRMGSAEAAPGEAGSAAEGAELADALGSSPLRRRTTAPIPIPTRTDTSAIKPIHTPPPDRGLAPVVVCRSTPSEVLPVTLAGPLEGGDRRTSVGISEIETDCVDAPALACCCWGGVEGAQIPSAAAANASAISRALWNRSSGFRASARAKKWSIAGPRAGSIDDGAGIGSAQIWRMSTAISPAVKGTLPVTHRKRITPSDQRSLRWSTRFEFRTCSGLMYRGEPMIVPVSVASFVTPGRTAFAIPKSRILAISTPSSSRARKMFPGLRSR